MSRFRLVLPLLATGACCTAQAPPASDAALPAKIAAIVNAPEVSRAHWGIAVTKLDGTPLYSLNDGQYFMPASNTKLFTTAAAMALLPVDRHVTTRVLKTANPAGETQDLVLVGAGDANVSGRPLPYHPHVAGQTEPPRDELRYIDELADSIRAAGVTEVHGDIVADDRLFPYDPYPAGWTIDDTPWYYGAPITAMMIADNAVSLTVTPGAAGMPPTVTVKPDLPYFTIEVKATTSPKGSGKNIDYQQPIGSRTITVYGHIAQDARPDEQDMAIEDPDAYAATALKSALEKRGVTVLGGVAVRRVAHEELSFQKAVQEPVTPLQAKAALRDTDAALPRCSPTAGSATTGSATCVLAEHAGAPLYDDIVVTNKVSQNQHAEMFLRLLGLNQGTAGTSAQGARVVRSFLTQQAGIDPQDFVFFDGSGLSTQDLVTPRAAAKLLGFAATQPWGARWKASLPEGGVDGSLRSRFPDPPLAHHVFAKTGTLGEARALSGYLDCASGQTVIFSVMVSTHSPVNDGSLKAMDAIVATIAATE